MNWGGGRFLAHSPISKENEMPQVGKKKFPYTAKGMADAKKAKKKMAAKKSPKKGMY